MESNRKINGKNELKINRYYAQQRADEEDLQNVTEG